MVKPDGYCQASPALNFLTGPNESSHCLSFKGIFWHESTGSSSRPSPLFIQGCGTKQQS